MQRMTWWMGHLRAPLPADLSARLPADLSVQSSNVSGADHAVFLTW
jgi:hypothetical protein